MPAISTRDLTFTYAGANAPSMESVSLSVEKGEFVILTGPSGCGKTTFCRCLNGLIPNFYSGELRGDIFVDEVNVSEKSTAELSRHIGFVFQNPENQLFSLSVERDVAFGLENLGVPEEEALARVKWAMKSTGIENLRNKAPYELSGGQQQRAAIAGVLAMKPEIIILDEPMSNLDPKTSSKVLKLLKQLNKELGMSLIIATHDVDLVPLFADEICILNKGQIVIEGPPQEIFAKADLIRSVDLRLPRITHLFEILNKEDSLRPDKQ